MTGVARTANQSRGVSGAHPLRLLRARAIPEPHLDRSPRLGEVHALVCVASHVTNRRRTCTCTRTGRMHAHDTQA